MICRDCGNGRHESCPGGTHCVCQHRTDRRPVFRPVPKLSDLYVGATGGLVPFRSPAPKEESNGR